jgi:hypothetical protein
MSAQEIVEAEMVLRADPEPARTNDASASSSRVRLCASATMTSRSRLSSAATSPDG